MPITFACACGKTLKVPDASAGKRAKCPVCGAVATVPEPDPVFEIVPPPLPPDPSVGVEPVEEPEPVGVPPLGGPFAGKPRYDDDDDATPYGLADTGPSSPDLDRDGKPRKKDGLPNFNKGRKNYG